MIKKISAIVLALVLCLSVIVVPTSAATTAELGSGKIAFALEWDKESYSKGDTAYLSVYMDAADDLSLYTGAFIIGLNSSVFSQDDNPIADVKANTTISETFNSYWEGPDTSMSWLVPTIVTKVQAANTAEENALYDQYLKYVAARNGAGSHPNKASTTEGFYGSEFNPSEPIVTFALKVKADVADGTVANAAITSGSVTAKPLQTTWKQYQDPGNSSKTANIAASDFNISAASTSATVGAVAKSIIQPMNAQIRFKGVASEADFAKYNGYEDDAPEKTFDVRTRATIKTADFIAKFGGGAATQEEAETIAKRKITEFGFIYRANTSDAANYAAFDINTAKGVADGSITDGTYEKQRCQYMQRTADGYNFTCLITPIADNAKNRANGVTCLAYVCCDGNYYFFDKEVRVDYATLYAVNPGTTA